MAVLLADRGERRVEGRRVVAGPEDEGVQAGEAPAISRTARNAWAVSMWTSMAMRLENEKLASIWLSSVSTKTTSAARLALGRTTRSRRSPAASTTSIEVAVGERACPGR